MVFDPCPHQITQLILKAGAVIRQLKGLPEEKNITILYDETAALLGMVITKVDSGTIDHLPSPSEMKDKAGKFILKRKDCPQCGRKDGLSLKSICPSCADSEDGKYHTMYSCEEIGPDGKSVVGCGFKTDKSEKFMVQRISEENPDWQGGMKAAMGIKTITDEGLK
jgi:hypothetical protein